MVSKLVCSTGIAAAILFSGSPANSQTLSDFPKRDAYAGAYLSIPFQGRRNKGAHSPLRMGFRAGYRQQWQGNRLRSGQRRTVNMDVMNLQFGATGFDRLSLGGQSLLARKTTGNWVFLADPDEEGSEKKSSTGKVVFYVLAGVGAAAGIGVAIGNSAKDAGEAVGQSLCDVLKPYCNPN